MQADDVLQTPGEIRAFLFVPRCSLCSYPHSRFRTARLSADDRSIAVLKSAKLQAEKVVFRTARLSADDRRIAVLKSAKWVVSGVFRPLQGKSEHEHARAG
jgi:hypothetical protein